MKRWNIKKIYLYSHHDELRELEFNVEDVTIITGDSQTGKSAIPEIIDYVMGSSECHIPSFVRSCLSWVGVLWLKEKTEFALIRKVPTIGRKSSQDYYFDVGQELKIPRKASNLQKKTNLEGGLSQFERLLGIGDAKTSAFHPNHTSKGISIRNAMPYLLQDDDVVISKSTLLRGANDSERKQSIIESLPYFLGVINEQTLGKEIELKNSYKQAKRIENRINSDRNIVSQDSSKALSLIQEAAQLGLCASIDSDEEHSEEELNTIFNQIISWDITQNSIENEDRLPDLYEKLAVEQSKIDEIKNKIKVANNRLNSFEEFNGTVKMQKRKLDVIKIFKDPHDPATCPLCKQWLEKETKPVTKINELVDRVQSDLKGIERDRPRLDSYVNGLKKELENSQSKAHQYKDEIETLVKEKQQVEIGLDTIQRKYRTIGRVSLFLESKTKLEGANHQKDVDLLNKITNKITELEQELNFESKLELLENVERRISAEATAIISNLPFENRFDNCPVYLNLRNLNVGISLPTHSENMRDVGSDENYLSLHVSLILALHRQFSKLNRPVPGVIFFDQLSRPYFPPDKEPGEVEIDNERDSLLSYFETIFNEVDRGESLQVIILEHAYFKKHERYKRSVKYRWKKNIDGLIPKNWPEISK
ncbi:DUF3732 domain-containing protein [Bacillus haikouensis]|nr:DUF3732 domain-containing protein [Bacillus haikouensis]